MKKGIKVEDLIGVYKPESGTTGYIIVIPTAFSSVEKNLRFNLTGVVNSESATEAGKVYDLCARYLNSLLIRAGLKPVRRGYNSQTSSTEQITSDIRSQMLAMLETHLNSIEKAISDRGDASNTDEQLREVINQLISCAKTDKRTLDSDESFGFDLENLTFPNLDGIFSVEEQQHIFVDPPQQTTSSSMSESFNINHQTEHEEFEPNTANLIFSNTTSTNDADQRFANNWHDTDMYFHSTILPQISTLEELIQDLCDALQRNNNFSAESEIIVRIEADSVPQIFEGPILNVNILSGNIQQEHKVIDSANYKTLIDAILTKMKLQQQSNSVPNFDLHFRYNNGTPVCNHTSAGFSQTYDLSAIPTSTNKKPRV